MWRRASSPWLQPETHSCCVGHVWRLCFLGFSIPASLNKSWGLHLVTFCLLEIYSLQADSRARVRKGGRVGLLCCHLAFCTLTFLSMF